MNKIIIELTEEDIQKEMKEAQCCRLKAIDYLLERIGENIYEYSYDIDYNIVNKQKEEIPNIKEEWDYC